MKRSIISVLIGFFCLAFAAQGFAQGMDGGQGNMPEADANALENGASSLSFGVPGGNNPYAAGTFGYWTMTSPNMNLGLNVGLSLDRQDQGGDTTTNHDILLAPAIKSYMTTDGAVTPYYFGQLNARFTKNQDPQVGIAGGFGVEWFPVEQFSVGGHTGLGIDILRRGSGEPVAIGTFTSGLSAQIYF